MIRKMMSMILVAITLLFTTVAGVLSQQAETWTISVTGQYDSPVMFSVRQHPPTSTLILLEGQGYKELVTMRCGVFLDQLDNGFMTRNACYDDAVSFDTFDQFVGAVRNYKATAEFRYLRTDGHDFTIDNDGNYYVIVNRFRQTDLLAGTSEMTRVMDFGFQKIASDGSLIHTVFIGPDIVLETEAEHGMDRRDAYQHLWVNSLDVDDDQNVYLSARSISAILKFDRNGRYEWQLGGVGSEFSPGAGTMENPFCTQHDVQLLENGNLLMFNNGGCERYSSGLELEINESSRVYTVAWEYDGGRKYYANHHGSIQRLPGGDTLIGWGSARLHTDDGAAPNASIISPAGDVLWEMSISPPMSIYRVKVVDLTIRKAVYAPLFW